MFLRIITFIFLLAAFTSYAQSNIIRSCSAANPIKEGALHKLVQKLKIHEDYLKNAVSKNDITQQFYGNIFLYTDHLEQQNYTEATHFALAAEAIAQIKGNASWQALVKLKTAWLICIVQNDKSLAIKEFKKGLKFSNDAKDSLCIGQCLEQIASMYGSLKDFDSARHYFGLAIPILKKFTDGYLTSTFNNFANMLAYEGKSAEALLYIDTAINNAKKNKNERAVTEYLTNRATVLLEMKRYDEAESLYKYCIAVNIKNSWSDDLVYDYSGLSSTYHATGKDAIAYDYLDKYYSLKDSILGVTVNLKVAGIEDVHANELTRLATTTTLQKRNLIIATIALLLLIALSFWRFQYTRAKKEQLKNKNSLAELTRILLQKNTQLTNLEQQVNELSNNNLSGKIEEEEKLFKQEELPAEISSDLENSLYNQRILTATDWAAFKLYFDNAYPGYLLRLRNAFPTLTEAEERLFLFLKLKITSKEAAAILGISTDSVKKTRSRLRKRLAIQENIDLEIYVSDF